MTIHERLEALGEIVQAMCQSSGLEVVGFTILVINPEADVPGTLTFETRSAVPRDQFNAALQGYLDAERNDPRYDEEPV